MNRRKHAPEAGGAALLRRSSTVVVVPLRWWAATSTLLALATLSCGQPLYQSPTLEISTPLADALGVGTGYNAEELAGYRDPGLDPSMTTLHTAAACFRPHACPSSLCHAPPSSGPLKPYPTLSLTPPPPL